MILVTGGTGLVGSHLLYDLVKSGKRVRAIKRSDNNISTIKKVFSYYSDNADDLFSKIEWVESDVLDIHSLLEAMEGVTEVYHCAAMVSFATKKHDTMLKVNIEGTANVVNAALEKKIKKLCYASSIAALGKYGGKKEIDEETFWKSSPDNSVYSISKYGAEREVWRGVQEGLTTVIVNPSIIVGPGNWARSSSNMFMTAYKGLKYYTDGVSGFVDVRDVSKTMIQLMDSTIQNERFIVSAENAGYKKFFDLACENLRKKKPHTKVGRPLSEFAWRTEALRSKLSGTNPLITRETARAAHQINYFSNEKVKKILNVDFIPLEQSVKDTCKLFLKDLETAL